MCATTAGLTLLHACRGVAHDINRYKGMWQNGKMHGKGTYYCADGGRCVPSPTASSSPTPPPHHQPAHCTSDLSCPPAPSAPHPHPCPLPQQVSHSQPPSRQHRGGREATGPRAGSQATGAAGGGGGGGAAADASHAPSIRARPHRRLQPGAAVPTGTRQAGRLMHHTTRPPSRPPFPR